MLTNGISSGGFAPFKFVEIRSYFTLEFQPKLGIGFMELWAENDNSISLSLGATGFVQRDEGAIPVPRVPS